MSPSHNPCDKNDDEQTCRIKMLMAMYNAVKGTELLLEQIQIDAAKDGEVTSFIREENAFKTLIATILSVRTKDENTMKVMKKLWAHYSTPKEIAEAPLERLQELIRSSGTYIQKSKRIKEVARIIHEKYHDKVPPDREKLLELPGVGRKVANCVLVNSFQIPAIPVDTHVHRISNRIGWVATKNPEETEKELEKLFPKEYWMIINYTMVSFGKNICKPKNPLCSICPIEGVCKKRIVPNTHPRRKRSKSSKHK